MSDFTALELIGSNSTDCGRGRVSSGDEEWHPYYTSPRGRTSRYTYTVLSGPTPKSGYGSQIEFCVNYAVCLCYS